MDIVLTPWILDTFAPTLLQDEVMPTKLIHGQTRMAVSKDAHMVTSGDQQIINMSRAEPRMHAQFRIVRY
jgi:hypothetical protein